MNGKIKYLIKKKKSIFQKQKKSNTFCHAVLTDNMLELSNSISFSKSIYHERIAVKPNDSKTPAKTYCSIFKTFGNSSKIPLIPLF